MRRHFRGEPRRRGPPGLRQHGRGPRDLFSRLAPGRVELGRARVVLLELFESCFRLCGVLHDVGEGRPVFPFELGENRPSGLHLLQALRIGDNRLRGRADVVRGFLQLRLEEPESLRQTGERLTPVEHRDGGPDRVLARALEHVVRARQGFAMALGVGEKIGLLQETGVLATVGNSRGTDFVHLIAQEVDLARPRPFVAAHRGQLFGEPARDLARLPQRRQGLLRLRPGKAVEQRALLGRSQERLVGMLAVEIDEPPSAFGELGDGREPTVHVAARPAFRRYDAREHHLVVAVVEPPFDARFRRALAHHLWIGASATEQVERVDDQRLARAGLAGDDREAGNERHLQLGDDPEILDTELRQHAPTGPEARTWSSGSDESRAAER